MVYLFYIVFRFASPVLQRGGGGKSRYYSKVDGKKKFELGELNRELSPPKPNNIHTKKNLSKKQVILTH